MSNELKRFIKKELNDHFQKLIKELKPSPVEEYLNREETAELLRVSPSSVDNYRDAKELKAYTIGNRILYKRSEIEANLKDYQVKK